MQIFSTIFSIVAIIYAVIYGVTSHELSHPSTALADSVHIGFARYDYAYANYMRHQGSVSQGRYPSGNSDLFPQFGQAPVSTNSENWSFGVNTANGAKAPYACVTLTVNSTAMLESVKRKAYQAGAKVISGANCTKTPSASGNLSGTLPVTLSAVHYYKHTSFN